MERREFIIGAAATVAVATVPAVALAKPTVERLIVPDIRWIEHQTETVRDNTRTIRYRYMNRWTSIDGKLTTIECAEVGSETYARWLAEDHKDYGYPPHIGFGGAVVPGKGDPEFYNRWKAYAATLD